MARTTLELGLIITASTGAAYGALQSLGQNLQRLNARVESATRLHQRLGQQISCIGTATASVAELTARYERLGRTIDQARANLDRLAETQRRIESHQKAFGELKGAALGVLGLGAGLAAPVKAAINFEEAFADVRKVVDGSDQELSAFSDKLLGMSRRLPLAATELAAIAASGGQLGIKLPDLPAYVETVAKMATAFDMPAEMAGDAMAKLANVFEIPIPRIGQLGDVINQISNETPARAGQIVEALGRIGGTARQFGLTAKQGAALTSAMIALGKPPEVAATSINALLTKLGTADKQGKKFQQALAAIGLSGRQLKAMIAKDAQGALNTFLQRLAEVPKAARTGLLVDLFGTEFADEIAALTGSLGTYQKALAAAGRAQGSMEKEFAARAATTANQLQLLKNNVAELGIAAGSALLPTLNRLIESVRPLVESLADFTKAHPALIAGIGKLAGLLFAFKAGSLAARAGMHLLSISWLGAVGRLQALRSAWLAASLAFQTRSLAPLLGEVGRAGGILATGVRIAGQAVLWLGRTLLLNPIGLIVTGLGAAAYLVWRHWDTIKAGFLQAWNWLKGLGSAFWDAGKALIDGLIDGVKSRIAEAGQALTNLGQAIAGKFKAFFGIRSPSRLFAWMGQNLSQGLALGIENDLGRVQAAMGKLNQATLPPVANGSLASAQVIPLPGLSARQQRIRQIVEPARIPRVPEAIQPIRQVFQPAAIPAITDAVQPIRQRLIPAVLPHIPDAIQRIRQIVEPARLPQPAAQSARVIPLAPHAGVRSRSAAPTITFSPRITVHAVPGQPVEAVRAQVQQAMDLSYEEFRRLMRRYEQETRRRALA